MTAILYLDLNAFVFFISQPDLVCFFSLSFIAVAGGCLEGGQGNMRALQCRKQELNCQVPSSTFAVETMAGYLLMVFFLGILEIYT